MVRLLVLLLLGALTAEAKDLSENVFNFPRETKTSYVKLTPAKNDFRAATVCMRFLSDITREYSIFSLATHDYHNGFLLFKEKAGYVSLSIMNKDLSFPGLVVEQNQWNSICATWEYGFGQVFLNGKLGPRKPLSTSSTMRGHPIITLGQEQDSYGGSFHSGQSLVGEITDVHMWDYVLPACEINLFMLEVSIKPGNVVNWADMSYSKYGEVAIKDRQSCKNN